ncbi:hypothetical protein [Streptomyces sp. KAU_LT]|uniref:hypothetical protein n=1 Tax=Streptomyces sp. KAU_LT TaxID=3046669 RepID=UPI0024B6E8D4|nr:hypothetical protein [Streptomyces sp. KAU_LT]MDI9832345.1 hypothetical protein [Streptomyces sp. KAU_LT]
MDEALMPTLGNLAWAPHAAIERVEILDRFNGVPTLGVLKTPEANHLFWRALGYVPDRFSVWIYAPIDEREADHLDDCEPLDLLQGPLFAARRQRYVTVGAADSNRLFFEREWLLPAGYDHENLREELLKFLLEAFQIALEQDLPPGRREIVDRASRVVRALTKSSCG